jgi:hypothetical protein
MLPSPVVITEPLVVTSLDVPEAAGRWRGGPAAAGATRTGYAATESPAEGPAALAAGGCCAWPLPLDPTCAGEGRRVFRAAASGLGLPDDLIYDGVTMASELAANTLHAQQNVQYDGEPRLPVVGGPELWLYLRSTAGRWELVCKVYDSLPGWLDGEPPVPAAAGPGAVGGRGLQVVAGLSGGSWGHHLSRSRLGGWKVPGKAVWFGQPVPAACVPPRLRRAWLRPCEASRRLEAMLAARGLGGSLLCADETGNGISVLSVRRGITVWCRADTISWRTRGGGYQRRGLTDLEDAAEQIVCLCQELDSGHATMSPGHGRVR